MNPQIRERSVAPPTTPAALAIFLCSSIHPLFLEDQSGKNSKEKLGFREAPQVMEWQKKLDI
jgi:hypothetical protein